MKILKSISVFAMMILAISLAGCKNKSKPIPSGIINKETMINIMVDVNLAEAALRVKQPSFPTDSTYIKAYYNLIFKKYNISQEQFNLSMKYYTMHPDKFGEIYDETLNKLSRIQSEENSKK